jgi:hypothetical protein
VVVSALPNLTRFGRYVVPFDLKDGPPRGFVFDGDSCVLDLDHETAARHDWAYLLGNGKLRADWRYMAGLTKDKRPLWGAVRWLGLTLGGWLPYYRHAAERRKAGLPILIAERMVPHADDDSVWVWPVKTWLLADLRRRWPDQWPDYSPDDC